MTLSIVVVWVAVQGVVMAVELVVACKSDGSVGGYGGCGCY